MQSAVQRLAQLDSQTMAPLRQTTPHDSREHVVKRILHCAAHVCDTALADIYHHRHEITQRAVSLFDRTLAVLQLEGVQPDHPLLYAAAALFVSVKVASLFSLRCHEFITLVKRGGGFGHSLTVANLERTERELLTLLDWNVTEPLPADFICLDQADSGAHPDTWCITALQVAACTRITRFAASPLYRNANRHDMAWAAVFVENWLASPGNPAQGRQNFIAEAITQLALTTDCDTKQTIARVDLARAMRFLPLTAYPLPEAHLPLNKRPWESDVWGKCEPTAPKRKRKTAPILVVDLFCHETLV